MPRRFVKARMAILIGLVLVLGTGAVLAQWGWGGGGGGRRNRGYIDVPERDIFPSNAFTFCRLQYSSYGGRGRGGGGGWATDYPESDVNFPERLAELTTIAIERGEDGLPKHAIVRATDPDLYKYPFIYMIEPGSIYFEDEEIEPLREYFLRGGFMLVDDFWGDSEYNRFREEIERVFPPEEYPIVNIPLSHEIFNIVFQIKEYPQVPSVGHYDDFVETGETFEWNHDYSETGDTRPHYRGIFDKKNRLMVMIAHNTDLGDGWEEEQRDVNYFRDFSVKKAYPMGINIVVYAMTH